MRNWCTLLVISGLCLCACAPSNPGTPTFQSVATPPVPTSDTLITYQDLEYKFELKYSEKDYHPNTYLYFGEVFALLLDVTTIFAGKNLEEVRIAVSVNPVCLSIDGYSPLTSDIEDVEINGVGFTRYSARDAGTHSLTFEHTTYQTQHADRCFEINISAREYVLEIFPNLAEYSKDLSNSRLDTLIQTFRFLD